MPLHTDNPHDLYILTPKSGNRKVGKGTPVSMSTMATCPPSCKLREGCYATCGRLGLVWYKLSVGLLRNGVSFSEFCKRITALGPETKIWRHNQAGDLPGSKGRLHRGKCKQLARANVVGGYSRGGYTYTHYPVLPGQGVAPSVARHNAETVKEMNAAGFCVNVSADNLRDADRAADLGIGPVAVLLPADQEKGLRTPAGRPVVVCPAVVEKGGEANVNCVDCKLCQRIQRKVIVGFPAHGTSAKKADKLARTLDGEGSAT